jgi:uncharacterized protein
VERCQGSRDLQKHGVSFEVAKLVFNDPVGFDSLDKRENYGEDRLNIAGMAEGRLLTATYTDRGGRMRIISARRATRHEQDDDFSQAL